MWSFPLSDPHTVDPKFSNRSQTESQNGILFWNYSAVTSSDMQQRFVSLTLYQGHVGYLRAWLLPPANHSLWTWHFDQSGSGSGASERKLCQTVWESLCGLWRWRWHHTLLDVSELSQRKTVHDVLGTFIDIMHSVCAQTPQSVWRNPVKELLCSTCSVSLSHNDFMWASCYISPWNMSVSN